MVAKIDPANPNASQGSPKDKIKRLASLIGFLEREIGGELASNPKEVWELKGLLEKNLWQSRISDFDPYWDFDSDIKDEAEANPGRYSPKEVFDADTQQGIKVMVYFHGLLKSFWEEFKSQMLLTNIYPFGQREGIIKVKVPENSFEVYCADNDGSVSFFSSTVNAIPEFIALLQGTPFDSFKQCKNPTCRKWFILTSKHGRSFCCQPCAAKAAQKIRREKDPEGFRKYHLDYYHRKVKMKILSEPS